MSVDGRAAVHLSKHRQDVGIVFFQRRSDGSLFTRDYEHWPWPRHPFLLRPHRLQGAACRVMCAEALLEEKENYARYTGRTLREKDRESIGRLRALLSR